MSISRKISTLLQLSCSKFHVIAIAIVCIVSSFASYAAPINPVTIEYSVKLEGVIADVTAGKIQTSIDQSANGYKVSTLTKAQGMAATFLGTNIQENCEFKIEQELAIPISYTGGTIKEQSYAVSYDWENRKINFADDESLDMPQGYIVDNCAWPFAISILQGLKPNDDPIYVVDGKKRRIRGYKVRATEQEEIRTPLGKIQTTKMILEREFKPERTFTFWLSNKDQYLPIKMQESRKSRTTTMMVISIEPKG